MIATDINKWEISTIYERFEREISSKFWRNRVRHCKDEIRGNAFLNDHLRREYEIAFQLDHFADLHAKYGRIPHEAIADADIFPGGGFAAQIVSLLDSLGKSEAEQLRRRVQGAFKNPDDMRGLCLELSVATHFTKLGRKVHWPESEGTPIYDLLIEDVGANGLEVECKSISNDKGRKIHEREALDFYAVLKPHLGFVRELKKGLAVVLTLPGRLPTTIKERQILAKDAARAIYGGAGFQFSSGADIRIKDFDPSSIGFDPHNVERLHAIVDSVSETNNKRSMVIGSSKGEGVLVFTIQSSQDDNLIKVMFDTLSDAARRQLTGTRPGLLVASLEGLDSAQMRSLSEEEFSGAPPTAIREGVSAFLGSSERSHLVGVGFLSRREIVGNVPTGVSTGGVAYYFNKTDSKYWSGDLENLFTWVG